MSDQPGLTPRVGLFGKHPAFGDFIGRGVPAALQAALEAWLTPTLAQLAAARGQGFAALYDHAPVLGFWIGAQVLPESGRRPLRGALIPSRDRVGRRFPLVPVQYPAPPLPPPLAQDDGFHAAIIAAADGLLRHQAVTAGDLLATLPSLPATAPAPVPAAGDDEGDLFWAANPAKPAAALWQAVAATDLQRASRRRSYWFADLRPGQGASAVLACDGLPDAQALDWLMAGVALPPSAPITPTTDAPGTKAAAPAPLSTAEPAQDDH